MKRNTYNPWGTAQKIYGGFTKHTNPPQTSIHRSPFEKTRLQRQLADLIIDNENLLYSQWFHGSDNVILDILSIDWHLDDGNILNFTHSYFPYPAAPLF